MEKRMLLLLLWVLVEHLLKGILCCVRQVVSIAVVAAKARTIYLMKSQRSISWGLILFSRLQSKTFFFLRLSIFILFPSLYPRACRKSLKVMCFKPSFFALSHSMCRSEKGTLFSQFCGENEFLCFMISSVYRLRRVCVLN